MLNPISEPLLNPYVAVNSAQSINAHEVGSSVLSTLLRGRAVSLAEALVSALERGSDDALPDVLQALGRESSGFLPQRLVNMLRAYHRFLTEPQHADVRERLAAAFWPIATTVGGQYCVTTPALLVIDAIAFSHLEWFHNSLFEAHSAARAHAELLALGFPSGHAALIAGLIAHQTLLRASWSTDDEVRNEVEAFYLVEGEAHWVRDENWYIANAADRARLNESHAQAVGQAIATTLFPFVDDMDKSPLVKRQVAAGLVLHSLCLVGRNSRNEPAFLKALKAPALDTVDHLLASSEATDHRRPYLFFAQYAQYTYDNTNRWKLLDDVRHELSSKVHSRNLLGVRPGNLTLCFPRVASREVWRLVQNQPNKEPFERVTLPTRSPSIWDLLDPTVGVCHRYQLPDFDHLCAALGVGDIPAKERIKKDVIAWLKLDARNDGLHRKAFESLLQELLPSAPRGTSTPGYLPAPLVGRLLQCMHEFRPDQFAPLHIVLDGLPAGAGTDGCGRRRHTIWLPDREAEVATSSASGAVPSADQCVASYVAAMIVSHMVNFAPRAIGLDYYSQQSRHWSKIIEKAIDESGARLMLAYVEQVRCDPVSHAFVPADDRTVESSDHVLGIDVGGTAIKLQVFELDADHRLKDLPINDGCTVNWAELGIDPLKKEVVTKSPDQGIENVDKFWSAVLSVAKEKYEQADLLKGCIAAGIAIPAPVNGGVPATVSNPMAFFKGIVQEIAACNPLEIHRKLNFAAALAKLRPGLTVVCLNDGDADLRNDGAPGPSATEGVTVVLKLGTGLAMGVHADGRQLELLAEAGKTVINLLAAPQSGVDLNILFPQGVLRDRCSAQAFVALQKDERFAQLLDTKKFNKEPGEILNEHLRSALVAIDPTDKSDNIDKHLRECRGLRDQRQLQRLRKAIHADDPVSIRKQAETFSGGPSHELTDEEKLSVQATQILGSWLADAIAHVVNIFRANEVRLAGGPLSDATGLFVTKAAERSLREVYGFDVSPVLDATGPDAAVQTHVHPRGIRQLQLVYPPEKSSLGGPRGAATAALDAHVARLRQSQLRRCRSAVMERLRQPQPFLPSDILEESLGDERVSPWSIGVTDVDRMLEQESAALGLTRLRDGSFTTYRTHQPSKQEFT